MEVAELKALWERVVDECGRDSLVQFYPDGETPFGGTDKVVSWSGVSRGIVSSPGAFLEFHVDRDGMALTAGRMLDIVESIYREIGYGNVGMDFFDEASGTYIGADFGDTEGLEFEVYGQYAPGNARKYVMAG